MKDWRSVALVAVVMLVLGRESAHTQPTGSFASPIDLSNPISVRITEPVPVILVAPVSPPNPPNPPAPQPPPAPPSPLVDPTAPDTNLARAGRQYTRTIPAGLQAAWVDMADRIERKEIVDKASAVRAHNQLSASLNTALDQVFAAGIDAKGNIINPAVITTLLRQSAAALGRAD